MSFSSTQQYTYFDLTLSPRTCNRVNNNLHRDAVYSTVTAIYLLWRWLLKSVSVKLFIFCLSLTSLCIYLMLPDAFWNWYKKILNMSSWAHPLCAAEPQSCIKWYMMNIVIDFSFALFCVLRPSRRNSVFVCKYSFYGIHLLWTTSHCFSIIYCSYIIR